MLPDTDLMVSRLNRCLHPKSIAVVGGREVERVVFQCRKMKFDGAIWPINPRRERLGGEICLPDVDALPEVPDAAFVAIPAAASITVVDRLSDMGVGGTVCYASGFREVGAADLHQQLVEAADDMPIIGPNCYGYVNALNGAVLWPDQHGMRRCERGVAVFSASGNICINISMQQRGLPLALMVSIGNQANVGVEALMESVLADDRITAIGLLIEGLKDLPTFIDVAGRAVEAGKPVIVLKNGRTDTGARIAMSHTATLAGESGLYDALFDRLGVAQTTDLETFLEALKLVSVCGPIRGNRIASMSCSGGEASLVADLAEGHDLEFPPMDEDHKAHVSATLNQYVTVGNPLDYHTFIWGDFPAMESTFAAMMQGGYDLTLLILDYPCTNDCDDMEWVLAGEAFARAVRSSGYPGALVVSMSENVKEGTIRRLAENGVTVLMGIPQALGAVEAASRVGRLPHVLPVLRGFDIREPEQGSSLESRQATLDEFHSKELLVSGGFQVPRGTLADDVEDAVEKAGRIGYPVVMKIVKEGVAHKSDQGGVRINLTDSTEARSAAGSLFAMSDRILVEQMVSDSVVELLLGASRDSQFGQYFIIGAGGTLVELLADRYILLPPLTGEMVLEALMSLKVAPLLKGYRGRKPADISAVVEAVLAFERFSHRHVDTVMEVEINPLIVSPQGQGAVAGDALIVTGKPAVGYTDMTEI